MLTAEFDYHLPPELIAQNPLPERDKSRLLVLDRASGQVHHRQFEDVPSLLRPGDVVVLNNSRVIPARLRGVNADTGGQFEMLLLEENGPNDWWAMVKPGKRARPGCRIELVGPDRKLAGIVANVMEFNAEGHRRLVFSGTANMLSGLETIGVVPLPPYVGRAQLEPEERERYQTVFAQTAGSVAAPTAGLHFTQNILNQIQQRGARTCFVTLHVGLGTFAPVKAEFIAGHVMHKERFSVSDETAREINLAKSEGRRVICVGTTTMRVLESPQVAVKKEVVNSGSGSTNIFIYPPHDFKIADALVTNFHLPRSTLLMLVSAFAAPGKGTGRETMLAAYQEAIQRRYRFFSYGDAMLIV